MKSAATKYKENLASLVGYCELAHMAIKKAMTPPSNYARPKIGVKNYNKRLDFWKNKVRYNKRSIERNIIFGLESRLIQHFADAYEYEEQKIRDAIIRVNQEKQIAVAADQRYNI